MGICQCVRSKMFIFCLTSQIDYDHGDDSNQSGSSGTTSGAGERSTSGGTSQEIEIVFKLHPDMLQDTNDTSMKEVVDLIKENSTRYIKTTSKALVESVIACSS